MADEEDDHGTGRASDQTISDEDLVFLRDEGLELIALYRSIRDERRRVLILELIRAIAEDQSQTDGA